MTVRLNRPVAAATLALALFLTSAAAKAQDLTIVVNGVEAGVGQLHLSVHQSAADFKADSGAVDDTTLQSRCADQRCPPRRARLRSVSRCRRAPIR